MGEPIEIIGEVTNCQIGGFTAVGEHGRHAVAYVAMPLDAQRIVTCWNSHDALLAACIAAADCSNEREYRTEGGGGTRHVLDKDVLKKIRAAILLAESQA